MRCSCTSEFYFRSICTFGCYDGFDIPKDMRRTKVCLASGFWNGADAECVGKIQYESMTVPGVKKNLPVQDRRFVGSDLTFSNPVKTDGPVETVQLRT